MSITCLEKRRGDCCLAALPAEYSPTATGNLLESFFLGRNGNLLEPFVLAAMETCWNPWPQWNTSR